MLLLFLMSRKNKPEWKTAACVIVFFFNNQVWRTFLSIPEGVSEKKRILVFIPAHFEGIWFLIWPAFRRGASGWQGALGQGRLRRGEQGSC